MARYGGKTKEQHRHDDRQESNEHNDDVGVRKKVDGREEASDERDELSMNDDDSRRNEWRF